MFRIYFLFFIVFSFFSCSKFVKIQKSNDWKEKYDAAIRYYENEDYYKASILFEELVPIIKGKKEAETIEFYLSYCYYYQNQLTLSSEYFKEFYETYGRSSLAEEAFFMYTKSLYESSPDHNLDQTTTYEAIDAVQSFINRYPESKFVEEGIKVLTSLREKLELKGYENAKLYHQVRNYKSAIVAFENFEKSFPDSRFNEEVNFLKIESQYLLARESIESKQKERFASTVQFYENFVDKYPESKFLRQAEQYYSNSLQQITQLANIK